MKKFLLQTPRLGTSPPAVGVGHAFKNWAFGRDISYKFEMEWVVGCFEGFDTFLLDKNISGSRKDRGGHTPQMFIDYFGLKSLIQNEKYNEIKNNYNISDVPADLDSSLEVEEYISQNYNNYDGFCLPYRRPIAINSSDVTDEIRSWFKDLKGSHDKSLCKDDSFNVCIPIRRGDRLFIPSMRDETDEWFLNELNSKLKEFDVKKHIKVYIFAETFNPTWWHEKQLFKQDIKGSKGRKWTMNDIHPDGHWLVEDFKNKKFDKIKNIYVNHEGKPTDIKKLFSKYDVELCLSVDIYTVIDSILSADLVVQNGIVHGSASLVNILK